MFLFITSVLDTVISLPFGLYKTFVIEEKHGFNKQTMSLYIKDLFISFALTCVIGGPVIAVIITIIRKTGELFYWYVWLFMLAVSVFLLTIFPTYIQPLFNKFTPLDEIVEDASKKWDKQLPSKIKALADQVKFPLDKIFVMDGSKRSSHSNAYFYGLWNKRIVLFDTLNTQVTTPELLAILGHEIGHWKLGHTLQMFVVQQFYTFTMFLSFSYMMDDSQLSSAFGFNYSEKGAMPVFIGLLLFTQVFFLPVDKVLRLGLTFNSRYNEFMADKFAKDTFNYGNELASGLIKISLENLGTFVPDWLYSAYNNSHPTLVERLNALELKKGKKE
jgi:STE24 endopeptidase